MIRNRIVYWEEHEKPCLNHWYRSRDGERDYWKILKDYHDVETRKTYYKIVTYYDCETVESGLSLDDARSLMKSGTYKEVYL